jgi:hypothetical protein
MFKSYLNFKAYVSTVSLILINDKPLLCCVIPNDLPFWRKIGTAPCTSSSSFVPLTYTVEAAYYNPGGCYQSAIVIKISGPKTHHLKSIKNKPFIITNLSVIVIKLQIIRVHI